MIKRAAPAENITRQAPLPQPNKKADKAKAGDKKAGKAGGNNRYDLPFQSAKATRLAPWMTAVMVFLACLVVAGSLGINQFANHWRSGLSGTAAIHIPPRLGAESLGMDALDQSGDNRIAQSLAVALATDGVVEARLLTRAEMQQLVKPWLGSLSNDVSLPLPFMISIQFSSDNPDALANLRTTLAAQVPSARLEDFGFWRQQIGAYLMALELVGWGLLTLTIIGLLLHSIYVTISALETHRQPIEILHQIGAEDRYLAREFGRYNFVNAFKGAFYGLTFAALVILIFGHIALPDGFKTGLLILPLMNWLWLFVVAALMVGLAAITSQITVLRLLHRLV